MSDRWSDLRDRFKKKDADLDAEFEKFLNESMSDESSLGSPRHKAPDLKSQSKKPQMPWWAEEDTAEEEKRREAARKSWMKPKNVEPAERKEQELTDSEVNEVTTPAPAVKKPSLGIKGSVTSLTGSYANTSALSISKDSLEEGLAKGQEKTKLTPEEIMKRLGSEDFEDTLTYSDEPHTGATGSQSSPIPPAASAGPVSVGVDTMNELEDKEKFFEDEEVGKTSVDYHRKLNEIASFTTSSPTQERNDEERLQATGAELGDSIFNTTGDPNRTVEQDVENVDDEDDDNYSDHFEESRSSVEADSKQSEESPKPPSVPVRPDVAKPSMLSKVSLMESLDATLETKRPTAAPRLSTKANKLLEDGGKQGKNDDLKSNEEASPTLRPLGDYPASGSTRDIQELQAALQAAQLTATETESKFSAEDFDEPLTGRMVLEKNAQGEARLHGFDLQPVIVTDDWSRSQISQHKEGKLSSLVTIDEARGFGLEPVRVGSVDGRQEPNVVPSVGRGQLGLASVTAEPRGIDLQPVSASETRDRGFDLMPAEGARTSSPQWAGEARDLDLKPAVLSGTSLDRTEAGRGFNLLPAEDERHGFSLQPVTNLLEYEEEDDDDTPPPESLQSIKNIARARKSAGRDSLKRSTERTSVSKKTTKVAKEGTGKKGVSGEKTQQKKGRGKGSTVTSGEKSRLYQPSPSSAPSWSPTPTMRHSRSNSKKSFGASKKLNLQSPPKMDDKSSSAKQLAESVESFANYLKHFVRPEIDEKFPPEATWSKDEPRKSVSRTSFRHVSDDDRLSREKGLQVEVENWQLAWKDEKKRNDKLIAEMASREKEWSRREEKCRLEYESQIHELKQELFVTQTKLNDTEKEADVRKKVAAGGNLEGVSDEELSRLEKEVREQEQLLTGYQQENERLYKELKQMQAKEKANEARMFSENQKLATELANLKEMMERRESSGADKDFPAPGSAALGADKISQLTTEMRTLRNKVTEVQDEAEELRRAKLEMETRLRGVENERDAAVQQNSLTLGKSTSEIVEIEKRHTAEIERMRNKLKWYAETQALLDRDVLTLRQKEEEISELRETVARLQSKHGQSVAEKKQRGAERAADAKRIQDLERQVREMEEIIRRRYPNSLPALIYAAASAPGQAQSVSSESPKKQSPTYAFLENRVRKLETELENKDEEASKRIRSIEQRYNALTLEYDDRVKDLENDLLNAKQRCEEFTNSNTRAKALEEELLAVRESNRAREQELRTEVQVLQDALAKAASLESAAGKVGRKKRSEQDKRNSDEQNSVVPLLREKLERKESELESLRQTCSRLQREREQMLVSEGTRVDRHTSPQPDPVVEELMRDNALLKEQLSQRSLDMDQQRIRFQGSLAESERNARLVREESADQLANVQAQHKRELEQLKAGFAVNHGVSKVAELKSKIAGQEIVIQRLKAKLTDAAINAETAAASKVREESLQQQINQLQTELKHAKEMLSPEMNHFDALHNKISSLEQRHFQRELDLQRIVDKTQLTANVEKEEIETRWRQVLRQKNREIEQFRYELDAILEVLSELKRQGVVIPFRDGEGFEGFIDNAPPSHS